MIKLQKRKKDRPPLQAKPAPSAANPKASRRKNSKEKRPTIQQLISFFAKEERKIKDDKTMKETLLRFVMYLEKKDFDIVDTRSLICFPYRYAFFTPRLKSK